MNLRITKECGKGRVLDDAARELPLVKVLGFLAPVVNVPGEGGELHDENHLRAGDLYRLVAEVVYDADDMAGRVGASSIWTRSDMNVVPARTLQ